MYADQQVAFSMFNHFFKWESTKVRKKLKKTIALNPPSGKTSRGSSPSKNE
jgi:hypothetical protein